MPSFKCHVCGGETATEEFVSEVFVVEGRRVPVERIPALVRRRCGEPTFPRETTERVRRLVRIGRPMRTLPLEVFALT